MDLCQILIIHFREKIKEYKVMHYFFNTLLYFLFVLKFMVKI